MLTERMIERIQKDLCPVDLEKKYDEMLDECFSFTHVGGIFSNMSPSRVLKEVDPIAYQCDLDDWADSEIQLTEVANEYYDSSEVDRIERDEEEEEE